MFRVSDLNAQDAARSKGFVRSAEFMETVPIAGRHDFDLKDKEMKSARSFIYGLNREGRMRFMTRWDKPILMVWRIK